MAPETLPTFPSVRGAARLDPVDVADPTVDPARECKPTVCRSEKTLKRSGTGVRTRYAIKAMELQGRGGDNVGCHTATSARGALIAAGFRVELLAETLADMIAKVPSTEFSTGDNRYTTGEGAQFNLDLAQSAGAVIHNPFLIEAQMTASMKQVTPDCGSTSPPEVVLDAILQTSRTN